MAAAGPGGDATTATRSPSGRCRSPRDRLGPGVVERFDGEHLPVADARVRPGRALPRARARARPAAAAARDRPGRPRRGGGGAAGGQPQRVPARGRARAPGDRPPAPLQPRRHPRAVRRRRAAGGGRAGGPAAAEGAHLLRRVGLRAGEGGGQGGRAPGRVRGVRRRPRSGRSRCTTPAWPSLSDRQGRAADHRAGAARAVRLPPGRGRWAGWGWGRCWWCPFARRRILGVVVDVAEHSDVPPEKLAEPLSALEADVPPELVQPGAVGGPRVRVHAGPRPGAGAAARAPAPAAAGGSARGGRCGRPSPPRGARRWRATRGWAPASARRWRRWPPGPARVSDLASATGCDHAGARRLEERGLRRAGVRRPGPGAAPHLDGGRPARRAGADRGPGGGAGRGRRPPWTRPPAPTGACCCTASPAAARPRSTCAPWPPRIERGRTAIVLVPEIALTPQTAGRFVQRFGDTVAVLHSQLTARERYDEWARLRSGAATVCVGPRSAVFAPLTDVGLIVVDEEHDGSYKQDGDPRYDARTVAERRAGAADCVLLAGTATPRPESFERYRRLRLDERVDGQPLPPVELVGMTGVADALHPRTRDLLAEVAERGEKAMVLLNRRGWSNFLTCAECGRVWECPECDVSLVLHRSAGRVSCHHCGHSERVPGPLPRLRLGLAAPPRAGHRAAGRRAGAPGGAAAGHAPGRRLGGRGGRGGHAGALRGGALGRAGGHPDGGQGPRLRRRDPRRGAGRRQHAALPRLPRRGAHVRAGGPAGGPQRPRLGPRARGGAGAGPRGPRAAVRRAARLRGLPARRAGPAQGAGLPALRPPGARGLLQRRARPRARGGLRAARPPGPAGRRRARPGPAVPPPGQGPRPAGGARPRPRGPDRRGAHGGGGDRARASAARAWRWRWTWTRSSARYAVRRQSRSTPAL